MKFAIYQPNPVPHFNHTLVVKWNGGGVFPRAALEALKSEIRENKEYNGKPIDFSFHIFSIEACKTILSILDELNVGIQFRAKNEKDLAESVAEPGSEEYIQYILNRGNLELINEILKTETLTSDQQKTVDKMIKSTKGFYVPEYTKSHDRSELIEITSRTWELYKQTHPSTHDFSDDTDAHSVGFFAPGDTHDITGDSVVTAEESL